MKSQEQIEARLKEAHEQRDEWRQRAINAREYDNGYLEYCRGIARETNAEVRILEWILATP